MLFHLLLIPLIAAQSFPSDLQTVFPSDASFSTLSQAYNQRFTFKPDAIILPTSQAQVSEALQAAHSQNLTVVARSGGHSYIANGLGGKDGSLVIDLSSLKSIQFNEDASQVTFGSGMLLGDIALALGEKNRAIAAGSCPWVGLGGHSAYGGFGFSSRMLGLTLDQILSIDGVLPNGTTFTASNDQNQDLFWALRGAAGSFAITTAVTLKTAPAPSEGTSYAYNWNLPADQAASLLQKYQDFVISDANPKELGSEITFFKSTQGYVKTELNGAYYGPNASFNSTLAPFLSQLPTPDSVKLENGNFAQIAAQLAGGQSLDTSTSKPNRDTFYAKSLMTPQSEPMSETAIKSFVGYLANEGSQSDLNWFVQCELYGGHDSAINAVPVEATAFAKRDTLFTIQFYASSNNYAPPFPDSGYSFLDNMVDSIVKNEGSDWDYGAYINYIDDRLIKNDYNWKKLYYGYNYDRLTVLKAQVDPNNTFYFLSSVGLLDLGATHLATTNSTSASTTSTSAGVKSGGSMLLVSFVAMFGVVLFM